ncbi:MAG: hypothetical protein ACOCRO_01780 [Halanaerobiales bacterium]
MIDRDNLKPGTWIVQNLIKHQNDYMIMRIDRVEKSMTYFDKMITFGTSSMGHVFKARIGRGFDIPTSVITTRPKFSLLKNANRKYKRMAILAIFKD